MQLLVCCILLLVDVVLLSYCVKNLCTIYCALVPVYIFISVIRYIQVLSF
uniref:Uncharacterized protein n=1 Tax=Arundo donax TaxID=35708 RepID=A0A0A9T264_ARUDO